MGECGLLNSVCKHYFDEVDIIGLSYSIAIISCNHNFSNSMLRGVKSRPNILHFHRLAQSLIFLLAASVMKSFAFVRTLTRTQCWSTPLVPFNSIQSGITPWRRLNVALLATNKRSLRAEGVPQPAKESKAREKSQNSPQQAAASTSPGSSIYTKSSLEVNTSDRPYTLPPGEFKPKQSLGQNYLSDQNYVLKIVNAFSTDEVESNRVVEIGPGLGALTRVLVRKYPTMTAVELDQRAVAFLGEKLPDVNVIHEDVLKFDWPQWAATQGGRLSVIANLPYYVTSQVLFALADAHHAIEKAVVTMQLEVAERVTASPGTKQYGIPSVVFQLYGKTHMNFKIPPKVFFPVPKVDSALVTIDFTSPHKDLHRVNLDQLRKVVTYAFRQRRKMLRQSLKGLIQQDELTLTERWATLRPEQISPEEFLYLTIQLYGERKDKEGDLQEPIETDNTQLELTSSAACEETDGMVIEETSCSMKQPHTSLLQRRRKNKQETEAGAPSEVVHAVNVPPHPDKSKYASCVVWRKALRNPEL